MSDFDFGVAFQGVQAQFGQKGHEWLGSGDAATTAGDIYVAIQAAEESVIDYTDAKTSTAFTNKTIPAGFVIVGELEQINVDSGNVIAYIGDFVKGV